MLLFIVVFLDEKITIYHGVGLLLTISGVSILRVKNRTNFPKNK